MDNPEQLHANDNVANILRNSLDSLHQLPESTQRLENFSAAYKDTVGSIGSKEEESLLNVDRASIRTWLTRNKDEAEGIEEPPATIWPVKSEGDDELEELNKILRNDIINPHADTLSGAIGKMGSDYYVDAFRQATVAYASGRRLNEIEGCYLVWLWHDMVDVYKPDTDLDFHTLLANELRDRFQKAGAANLSELVNQDLVHDTFVLEAGDTGAFPSEVEKTRKIFWQAANTAVKLFDSDPSELTPEDYITCLDQAEEFARAQDEHPSMHGSTYSNPLIEEAEGGSGITSVFAKDIGVDVRAVDAILTIGSGFPHQIIQPENIRGRSHKYDWDVPKNTEEIPSYSDKQLTTLGILGYLARYREIKEAMQDIRIDGDEATALLLEFVMDDNFMPETRGDLAAKEQILRNALGNEVVIF